MYKFLKTLRLVTALFIGAVILLYFLDSWSILPGDFGKFVHVQFIPALISGHKSIVLGIVLMTLLFGRIYCSVICPLGILQDVILRIRNWWYKFRGKVKKTRTAYQKPFNIIRFSILGLTASTMALGAGFVIMLLDPYSNFGRIAVNVFKPAVVFVNNLFARASLLDAYRIPYPSTSTIVLLISIAVLVVLIVMVWRRERMWCNTVCPVGVFLGVISKYSLFRVKIDETKCKQCKLCTTSCKARCIDDDNFHVDSSRCVTCYNCLTKCRHDSISYKPNGWNFSKKEQTKIKDINAEESTDAPSDPSRRLFLKGSLAAVATVPIAIPVLGAVMSSEKQIKPLPPGAVSLARFREKCTACQLCVNACPMHVIKPADLENGILSMMQPCLDFKPHSYCSFECRKCIEVCPNDALQKITLEEKKLTQIGVVDFVKTECVVYKDETDCGACAEHCPTQAVHMVEYKDGLTIPSINPDICIGCGGCESICPVRPNAIFIKGNRVQKLADKPKEREARQVEIDDFGF